LEHLQTHGTDEHGKSPVVRARCSIQSSTDNFVVVMMLLQTTHL